MAAKQLLGETLVDVEIIRQVDEAKAGFAEERLQ
jgi:hypothetical protein